MILSACAFNQQCAVCNGDGTTQDVQVERQSYLPEAKRRSFTVNICHPMCENTMTERCPVNAYGELQDSCDCQCRLIYLYFI